MKMLYCNTIRTNSPKRKTAKTHQVFENGSVSSLHTVVAHPAIANDYVSRNLHPGAADRKLWENYYRHNTSTPSSADL